MLTPFFVNYCSNTFYNNILIGAPKFNNGCGFNMTEANTISLSSPGEVFISYTAGTGYPFLDNYHLKNTCVGKNAGTDGTDVGIYGTSQPTSEGWVPSNPHIYFKQIDSQTGTNGTLKIQVKVRTNN